MPNLAFFDVVNQLARASLSGTSIPALGGKLLTDLAITAQFFNADGVTTVDSNSAQIIIIGKDNAQNDAALIDTTATFSGNGATAQYLFEWPVADSVQLRAVLDAAADPTQPLELRYQLIYAIDGKAATIGGPIYFENNFFRPDTPAPVATEPTSWPWLKARLVAGAGITLTNDDTAKTITIAAPGIATNAAAIAAETTARAAADTAEANARATADTTLQSNLDAVAANISRWTQYDIDGGGLYWAQVADIGNNVITDLNETNACWVFLPLFADAITKRGVIRILSTRNWNGDDQYIGIYPNPAEWSNPNRMLVGQQQLFSAYTTSKGLIELMPVTINGTPFWQVLTNAGGPLQDRDLS